MTKVSLWTDLPIQYSNLVHDNLHRLDVSIVRCEPSAIIGEILKNAEVDVGSG